MITRHGFYDSTADQGFGWDKIWNKHGIASCAAIQYVLESPNRYATSMGTDTVNFDAYADEIVNNEVVDEVLVTGAYEFASFPTYFGQPGGTPLGTLTMCCNNDDNSARCPTWVTQALSNGLAHETGNPIHDDTGGSSVTFDASYTPEKP